MIKGSVRCETEYRTEEKKYENSGESELAVLEFRTKL